MSIKKFFELAQKDFYENIKKRKILRIYQKIGEYIYELYKSGEVIYDENLLKLLKELDNLNKDEK